MQREPKRMQREAKGIPLSPDFWKVWATIVVTARGTSGRSIWLHDCYLAALKLQKCKNYKKYKDWNLQKLIILEGLEPWEYEYRIRHVEKQKRMQMLSSVYRCQERRVMAILHKILNLWTSKHQQLLYVFWMFSRLGTMLERFLEAKSCI